MVDGVGVFSSKYNLKPSWLNHIDVELCVPITVLEKTQYLQENNALFIYIKRLCPS